MGKARRTAALRWTQRELAGQPVFSPDRFGLVPVDVETGFLGRYPTYEALTRVLLAADGDVTVAERPGFGRLKALPGPCEVERYVELKRERLDARREEMAQPNARFVLIGHSMGAAITTAFAARYPEYVTSIIDINGIGDPHPNWSIAEWYWRGLFSLMPADAHLHHLGPYVKLAARGYRDALLSTGLHPSAVAKHAWFCMGVDNHRAELAVGEARIPVTLIRGERDLWVPKVSLQRRGDRMQVPTTRGNPLAGRHTLAHENHLLGNTVSAELEAIIGPHMAAVSREVVKALGRGPLNRSVASSDQTGRSLSLQTPLTGIHEGRRSS